MADRQHDDDPTDEQLLAGLAELLDAPAPPLDEVRLQAIRREAASRAGGARRPRRRQQLLTIAAGLIVAFGVGAVVGAVVTGESDGPTADGVVEFDGVMVAESGDEVGLSIVKTGIGRVVEIDSTDLAILPTGEHYELWFVAAADGPVDLDRISAGTFHPDADGRSAVRFAAAVDPALYPIVQITAEPGDGDPAPSGDVVIEVILDE